MSAVKRIACAVPLGVVLALGAGSKAAALPLWLPPETVSETETEPRGPAVAVDGVGEATVVWTTHSPTATRVMAATRSPSGTISAPEVLTEESRTGYRDPHAVAATEVVVSDQGEAIALLLRIAGANSRVEVVTRPPGGTFGDPEAISSWRICDLPGCTPQLAMNRDGDAIAVWPLGDRQTQVIQAASRSAGGSFGSAETLSAASDGRASEPTVAMGSDGTAIILWTVETSAGDRIQSAERSPDGTFAPSEYVSPAGVSAPAVAIDSGGDATAVAVRRRTSTSMLVIAARRPAGGAWVGGQTISRTTNYRPSPTVAVGPQGDAAVAWLQDLDRLQMATSVRGAPFGKPRDVSPGLQRVGQPLLSVNSTGRVTAVWPQESGIWSAYGPLDGPYLLELLSRHVEAPVGLIPSSLNPDVASDAAGDPRVAVWQTEFNGFGPVGEFSQIEIAARAPIRP